MSHAARSVLLTALTLPAASLAKPAAAAPEPPAAAAARAHYDRALAPRLVPLLSEVLRFPTVEGNADARRAQQAWLKKTGEALGFVVRDAGAVTEIELPGGGPVLGLLVHGDVQPVEAGKWSIPPFEGAVKDDRVLGRGAADDKGPLVQALLAMKALRDGGVALTHTVRLLVGSDEESGAKDVPSYLQSHQPPAYSLVLDSAFPVVVGEKAWNALFLTTPLGERGASAKAFEVVELDAGLSPSIVPDEARLVLRWKAERGPPAWEPLIARVTGKRRPAGIRVEATPAGDRLTLIARGKSAHGGVNLEGGVNALVALAGLVQGELPAGGANDLLAAARQAGKDLYGGGLGIQRNDPLWGRQLVNVATLKPVQGGHRLTINIRTMPGLVGPALKAKLAAWTARFNARTGAKLLADGYYEDTPLAHDPRGKLVRRLMAAYTRATGQRDRPAISGGGTYAKRMPRSIAFGMWFPGKAYPGHDVDEQVPVADLHRGAHVLIEALVDLAAGPPLEDPFAP